MDITVSSTLQIPFSHKNIQKKVEYILYSLKKKNASISIHIIGDKKMTDLNFRYRGKKRPTDVLSFAAQEGEITQKTEDWGDMFICLPQVKRQAKEYHVSWQEEFHRMLIHGILHLFGYDHMEAKDAKKMFALQEKILTNIL